MTEPNRCYYQEEFVHGSCIAFSQAAPGQTALNEDAWMARELTGQTAVLAIADGAGGRAKGDYAAWLMIDLLNKHLDRANDVGNLRAPILTAIEDCNDQLLKGGNGSASTVIVVEIQGNYLRHYLVGDSSVFLVGQRGRIRLQSVPQSLVGYGVEAGLLPEDAALEHDERHVVLNLVGLTDMRVEVGTPVKMQARDTLLMCSDGLTDNVSATDIVQLIRSGDMQQQLDQLVREAHDAMQSDSGHPDDLSLLVFRRR